MGAARGVAKRFFGRHGPLVHPALALLGPLLSCLAFLVPLADAAPAHADTPGIDPESCLRAHEGAQLQRLRGRYLEAREQLLQCAQAACPAVVRGDCKTWLGEVETSLPTLVLAVVDDRGHDLIDVRVSNAGQLLSERADGRAVVLNPGVYTLRFEAAGYAPQELQLSIREAEKQRIVRVVLRALGGAPSADDTTPSAMPTEPDQRQRRLRLSGYVLGGAAVAALGTAIGFAVSGKKKLDHLQACKPECDEAQTNTGRRRYIIADSMFAAAGAFAVAATVTLWLGLRKAEAPPALTADLDLQRGGASLRWSTEF